MTEVTSERLRRAARSSEEAEAARIRAQLRTDRGDHRRGAAAGGASGVVVGDLAQPAGKDAAARGLPRRRLHRDKAGGRQERAVQEDEVAEKFGGIYRCRPGEGRDPYAAAVVREAVPGGFLRRMSQQRTSVAMGPGLRRDD